jgi:phosphatidylglycerophosphate synthase
VVVTPSGSAPAARQARAWILSPGPEDPASEIRIWGLSPSERLRRAFQRLGAASVQLLAPGDALPGAEEGPCVVARADWLVDERLVQALLEKDEAVLTSEGRPVAARVSGAQLPEAVAALREKELEAPGLRKLPRVAALDLAPAYNPTLRKFDPPFLAPARAAAVREIEDRIFESAYKGLTDLVTRWVWPRPARAVTRWLAKGRVRPNTITVASYALVALVVWLFARGLFGAGLLFAWLMTFLDTVDGKLARVTLTQSRVGHVLDHGLDLVHPPIWWIAWAVGLGSQTPGIDWAVAIVVGGYLLGRALEGVFLLAFRMEIFLWRPFDGFFRAIIARRNPNLLLLSAGTLAGRPELGFWAVAVWTLVCNAVHVVRIAQAFSERSRGIAVRPWRGSESAA